MIFACRCLRVHGVQAEYHHALFNGFRGGVGAPLRRAGEDKNVLVIRSISGRRRTKK